MDKHRGTHPQYWSRGHVLAEEAAVQAADTRESTRCILCGLREQAVTRRIPLSASVAGVITCHLLACGHAWHRTIANVGGIFPGLVRNATFAPCDCPDDLRARR